jgi:hypothetical protein
MQEFVNKQLPSWINEGVLSELRSLPKPLLAMILEQIQEVIQLEQYKGVPSRRKESEERERAFQEEKKEFKQWTLEG